MRCAYIPRRIAWKYVRRYRDVAEEAIWRWYGKRMHVDFVGGVSLIREKLLLDHTVVKTYPFQVAWHEHNISTFRAENGGSAVIGFLWYRYLGSHRYSVFLEYGPIRVCATQNNEEFGHAMRRLLGDAVVLTDLESGNAYVYDVAADPMLRKPIEARVEAARNDPFAYLRTGIVCRLLRRLSKSGEISLSGSVRALVNIEQGYATRIVVARCRLGPEKL